MNPYFEIQQLKTPLIYKSPKFYYYTQIKKKKMSHLKSISFFHYLKLLYIQFDYLRDITNN